MVSKNALYLLRKKQSHKGENGRLLVIGGSEEYPGAVYLAAMAAARTGVDIVRVATPRAVAWILNSLSPDIITVKLQGKRLGETHYKRIIALASDCDAILLGNGIGKHASTKALCRKLSRLEIPKVIDAEGLYALRIQDCKHAILTPHKQEFTKLLKNSGMDELGLIRSLGANVVLKKGNVDIIMANGRTHLNRTGNPMMTVSGTGDILAGVCAGLLAQSGDLYWSACEGAFITGSIGDLLLKKEGSFLASDFLPEIARLVHLKRKFL